MADLNLLDLVVLSAAIWRISHLFVWEDGPYHIFQTFRESLGIRYDINGERIVPSYVEGVDRFFAELFSCVYCLSIWLSFFFVAIYWIDRSFSVVLAVPFALSAGALVINRWCDDYG